MIKITKKHPLIYLCAEYGLQADLPLYAGGLGVLAGDTVKAAADIDFPLIAIGLLYKKNKAIQVIDSNCWQTEDDLTIDPATCELKPVNDPTSPKEPMLIKVHLTNQDVWAKVWKKSIKNVDIYLFDTDIKLNDPQDRDVTYALYYGSEDDLVKQQMVLGIASVKLLGRLGIEPTIYHINEGRPAFCYWQLIRKLMDKDNFSFKQASAKARSMIVYTNHTLVRAGNITYDTNFLAHYALYYANKMDLDVNELLKPPCGIWCRYCTW